jgi:xanthine dehydrogenase accessory factor
MSERPLSGPPSAGLPRDWLPALVAFLDREPVVVRIVVAEVRGSTPREPGAFMLVGRDSVEGSIGGGQLEWEATAGARELLADTGPRARVNKVVLGPDVGQCCGGVVSVLLERFTRESLGLLRTASEAGARGCAVLSSTIRQGGVEHSVVRRAGTGTGGAVIGAVAAVTGAGGAVTRADRSVTGPHPGVAAGDLGADEASDRLLHEPRQSARPILTRNAAGEPTFIERLDDEFPAVWLYGAGHVGQALARILVELPLRLTWIDSRAELFPDTIGSGARILHDPDTLSTVSEAPVGAYFIVMSHSHPLDYSLCHALLERNDFAWLGLIGSMSKAARFRSRLTRAGLGADVIRKLVCPIGVDGIDSKWPAAIAVAVAAQLMQQISAPPHTPRAQVELMRGEALGVGVTRTEAQRAGVARAEAADVELVGAELMSAEAPRAGVSRPEAAHVELAATELARAEGRRGERDGADPACAPENCATCGTTPSRRGTVTS